MTRAQPLAWFSTVTPQPSLGRWASLGPFYLGLFILHLGSPLPPGVGLGLVVAGVFLGLLVAPIEYALGALGYAFLAASCSRTTELFYDLRWAALATAAPVMWIRFVLRRRGARSGRASLFDYLLLGSLILSAATLLTTVSVAMTTLKLLAMLCLLFALSQGVYHLCDTYGPAAPRRLTHGLLAYAGGTVALSLLGLVLPLGLPVSGFGGWFQGLLGGPNAWAALASLALPWCASPLFRRRQYRPGRQWALAAAVALVGYSLARSGSRAGLLGGLVALSLLSLVHLDRRIASAVLLATFFLGVRGAADPGYFPNLVQRYIYKHTVSEEDLFQSRLEPWNRAQRIFLERPWMGYGFGVTSLSQAAWVLDTRSGAGVVETGSSFWGTLGQVGLLGAVPLFLAIGVLTPRAVRYCRRVRDPWLTGLCGSMLALLANAFFEGWLLAPGNFTTCYFWCLCFLLNAMMGRFRPALQPSVLLTDAPPYRAGLAPVREGPAAEVF